ncbi:MAG: cache domain-containing protein, partial [Lachnospiraceae bacterium]
MKSAKRKRIVLSTAVLVIATVIIAGALLVYARMINKRLIEEINQRGKQISEQNEFSVEEEIKGQMNSLMEISERISASGTLDADKEVTALKSIGKRYSFKRMAIIMPDGEAYTTDKVKMNLSEHEFFQKSMQGENFISGRISDYSDGEDIIVFSVPIYIKNRVEGVLIATYSAKTMQDMLALLSGEDCDSYVVDAEGKLIVSSIQDDKIDYESKDIYSILNMSGENEKDAEQMQKDITEKKSGSVALEDTQEAYVHYLSLGINDWYLVNVISSKVLDSDRNFIMGSTYLLATAVIFVFILFIAYIMGAEKKKRQKMEQLMNVDELTGGNTYLHFCDLAEEKLKHTDKKAALISMDIQNFKLINEMYGKEEGDRVLRYLYKSWENWITEEEIFGRRIADSFFVLAFYDNMEEILDRIEDFIEHLKNDNANSRKGHVFRAKM